MSEQPTPDLTPVAVPDTSSPTIAELEAKIAELEAAASADNFESPQEEAAEAAVFRADTSDTTAPAEPAPAADAAPATPAPDSAAPAPVAGSVGNSADGASGSGDVAVSADTAAKVDEIHRIAVEVSDFVSGLAPLFEDIQKNGLGSLLGGMFGRR